MPVKKTSAPKPPKVSKGTPKPAAAPLPGSDLPAAPVGGVPGSVTGTASPAVKNGRKVPVKSEEGSFAQLKSYKGERCIQPAQLRLISGKTYYEVYTSSASYHVPREEYETLCKAEESNPAA